jgi:hypothetical protein
MRGKYDPTKPINTAQLQLMVTVIECLGGVFGFLPMYRPYIPEPMRHALFRTLMQHKPRTHIYFSLYQVSESPPTLLGSALKRLINDPAFPRTLLPSWIWGHITEDERYGWRRIDTLKVYHPYERRIELCRLLLGIKSDTRPTIDDIPTTFSNLGELQGFQKLATYIGMPMHELENLIAWEAQPLSSQEKAALAEMVSLIANKKTDKSYYERNSRRIYGHYGDVMAKRLGVSEDQSEKASNRQIWQMGELVFFVGMCLEGGSRWLAHSPVKIPSGRYEDTPKREKTQGEMITEMVLALGRLPARTAYAKVVSLIPGQESVWMGKILPLKDAPVSGVFLADAKLAAWLNVLDGGILRRRRAIEEEIRERQDNWRRRPGSESPPPTST